jgi:hypothetical protein
VGMRMRRNPQRDRAGAVVTTYRVGNHQPQNLYRDDTYIGVMFTAEDAALVVEVLNGTARIEGPRGHGICDCEGTDSDPTSPTTGLAMDHHCDCRAVQTAATFLGAYSRTKHAEACGNHGTSMDEFYRSVEEPPPIQHHPETPGSDGLGYGRCTGCGEMWPCKASRVKP